MRGNVLPTEEWKLKLWKMNSFKLYWLFLLFSFAVSAQEIEVFFDFNKDHLTKEAAAGFKEWINEHTDIQINKLSGYCDSIDTDSYNADLSLKRIQSILKTLEKSNIVISNNIIIEPHGENFKQSKIQAENRKVVIQYSIIDLPKKTIIAKEENASAIKEPEIVYIPLKRQFEKAKKGDLIKLQNISFKFNSEQIIPESEHILTELWQILVDNPKLKIEIQGHICCNPNPNDTKLSYRRAKYILGWLLEKGIDLNRLSFIGYGSSRPLYPIPEKNYKEEVANRRVEILIIEK